MSSDEPKTALPESAASLQSQPGSSSASASPDASDGQVSPSVALVVKAMDSTREAILLVHGDTIAMKERATRALENAEKQKRNDSALIDAQKKTIESIDARLATIEGAMLNRTDADRISHDVGMGKLSTEIAKIKQRADESLERFDTLAQRREAEAEADGDMPRWYVTLWRSAAELGWKHKGRLAGAFVSAAVAALTYVRHEVTYAIKLLLGWVQ